MNPILTITFATLLGGAKPCESTFGLVRAVAIENNSQASTSKFWDRTFYRGEPVLLELTVVGEKRPPSVPRGAKVSVRQGDRSLQRVFNTPLQAPKKAPAGPEWASSTEIDIEPMLEPGEAVVEVELLGDCSFAVASRPVTLLYLAPSTPEQTGLLHIHRAMRAQLADRMDDARAEFAAARNVIPEHDEVLRLGAFFAANDGRWEEGLAIVQELSRRHPEQRAMWNDSAAYFARMRQSNRLGTKSENKK